jgi:rod shape determining protein RodA
MSPPMSMSKTTELLKKVNFSLLGQMLLISIVGILNLYSATSNNSELSNLWISQIIWLLLSLSVGLAISFVSISTIKKYAYFSYIICLGLLILVLLFGHRGMGAVRWINIAGFKMQPSEFMKLSLILALSHWFDENRPELDLNFKSVILPALMTFIPMLLIVVQPDLGTGMILLFILTIMVFYRSFSWRNIAVVGLISIFTAGLVYNVGLREYQRKRVETFLDPEKEARGAGYNAIQSKIAIGSGRLTGKGFKNSTQASLQFLPENHTDFAFAIFSEEHGFLGDIFLISLYLYLLYLLFKFAGAVTNPFSSFILIGVLAFFFCHIFVNMAMVMGLLPIVGVPLPFMSYGGSSMLTFGTAIGIATAQIKESHLFYS